MSQQTEQVEESTDAPGSVLDWFEDRYHVPVLAAAVAFMLWVRLQSIDRFTRGGEVFFDGNDAWYHLRQVTYTVGNWPRTMPFDPWTNFPRGTSVGQFGTLYDQLVATAALAVGLGDPTQRTVAMTLLVAPAVFGALVAVPTYLVGKRLGGRPGGLFAVVVLALFPGTFLRRSLVGFADHNVAEPLFQTFAVLAMMVALTVAEREKPVYELVAARDFEAVRRPLVYSALAGVATALYLWTWPPGVFLVGIFGVFFALALTADYVRGVSPDHLAFVGAVSMGVAGLLALVPLGTLSLSVTRFSPIQPMLAFGVAGACVFLAWLARTWDGRDFEPLLYPTAIVGLGVALAGFVYVAFPGLYSLVQNNVFRVVGFGTNAETRTIGEAQPFLSEPRVRPQFDVVWYDVILREYGLMLFTAVVAAAWMVWRAYRADDLRADYLLVLVWAAFVAAAAFTQVRFNYYLAVPVAVLNAYLVARVLAAANLTDRTAVANVQGYQVLALLFVVLIVTPVLIVPATIGTSGVPAIDETRTAMQAGQTGPQAVTQWDGSLDWMANNTPAEGNYGGADNADRLDYYGTYYEADGDFSYPEGAYGVMSWWDYGHWITVEGERIPNANPFQEGASTAARYLLAPSEERANEILRRRGEPHEETRYVMVDWMMVEPASKFSAPPVFHPNVSADDFYSPIYQPTDNGPRFAFRMKDQRYYRSQVARLYLYHGSRVEASPLVVDWNVRTYRTFDGGTASYKRFPTGPNATVVRRFQTMEQARQFVEEDGSAQIGGVGPFPSEDVPALEHYRIVKQSRSSGATSREYAQVLRTELQLLRQAGISNPNALFRTSPSWVKTFERVPGATVEGTGPPNATVTTRVRLSPVGQNGSFVYRQQAETGPDGGFTMTLPYSSTGYENWGPEEGYTNVSVRAAGPYQFNTPQRLENENITFWNATAHVTESQVIGENDSATTVTLTEESIPFRQDGTNNTTANGTDGTTNATGSGGNATATDGTGTTNDTGSLAAPAVDRPTLDRAAPDREPAVPLRAGLVGAYAAALLVGTRD